MGRQGWTHRTDHNTKLVVGLLRAAGYEVHFIDRPVDLLVAIHGVWVLVEVKSNRGKLTSAQQKFFETTEAPAFVVSSVDEMSELASEICNRIFSGNKHDILELARLTVKPWLPDR
jgi:hypothetical protein